MGLKKVYFISDSIPNNNSFGSEIIFYRHLKALEKDGYDIFLFVSLLQLKSRSNSHFPHTWKVNTFIAEKFLPLWFIRRFRSITHLLYLFEFLIYNKLKKPEIVLSYLWDVKLCTFAAYLSKVFKAKLFYFIHDNNYRFGNKASQPDLKKINSYCIKNSRKLFCVSNELGYRLVKLTQRDKIVQLLPMPEGIHFEKVDWSTVIGENKTLVFSGSFYKEYFPIFLKLQKLLEKINGKLIIIAKNQETIQKYIAENQMNNTSVMAPFDTNKKALEEIRKLNGVLLISYPNITDEIFWVKDCFPSKFIEYSYLGLPALLIAPKETAFYKWVKTNTNIPINTAEDTSNIEQELNCVFTEQGWNENRDRINNLSKSLFSAEKIHQTLKKEIE